MALVPGSRIGPYEVVGSLGAGGMGEVYRARDARLNREVAIKAIPELFAMDADRIARFEREAQILAALSHPNIAGIYGLEETPGPAPGQTAARYLVLELIPGETLAHRIAAGALPLAEALTIARQIADALEAAHDKGIIHRDLKPGNVMLTPDGAVKVLDFGLAKSMDAAEAASGTSPSGPFTMGQSPTFASPAVTGVGLVIGTAAYMAPEQAKGRAADRRSDVWAFGCVLYELLTGASAFGGEDLSDTLAAVLRAEPDWSKLPASTPPAIDRLLRRCLQKDRKLRLPDISIARFEIDEYLAGRSTFIAPPPSKPVSRRGVLLASAGGVLAGAAAAAALARFVFWPAPAAPIVARFEIKPPAGARMMIAPIGSGTDLIVSPDGRRIVFRAAAAGVQLAVRMIDETEAAFLPGTVGAQSPSFSPSSTRIAFQGDGKLQVLTLGAAAATIVCELPGTISGSRWLNEDVIVFAQRGLFRVAATGGTPEPIVSPDNENTTFSFPEVADAGRVLLFTITTGGVRHIAARNLATGEQKIVVENATFPRATASGHLVFIHGGRLAAARFDAGRLQLAGPPVQLTDGIVVKFTGAGSFDIGVNGTFASMTGDSLPYLSRFQWRARDGKVVGTVSDVDLEYPRYHRISPDGRRLAATVGAGSRGQIWIFDLADGGQPVKLTFGEHNLWPTWMPDGKSLVFTRIVTGAIDDRMGSRAGLLTIPADGSTLEPKMLVKLQEGNTSTTTISPDGRWLLYGVVTSKTGQDIMMKALDGSEAPKPWLSEAFHEGWTAFSPDGKWVAYGSTQTGGAEIWVRPFPGPGAPIRVSPAGGREPLWSRDGRELFYQQGAKLMAATVAATAPELRFDAPRMLFEGGFVQFQDVTARTYDVARDGRFLMIEDKPNPSPAVVTVVTSWTEKLPR